MYKKIVISAVVILSVIAVAIYGFSATGKASAKDGLAKCLSENGAVMYGASWCGHCANQKSMFGSSWQYVNYVECVGNEQACTNAGIQAYPTWIFGDGTRQTGELTLQQLSQISGCIMA